ncbi:MAG: Zn-dependent alcohol dehydrogenase [Chloroflexi bacterium]|nr:Zn-dependent alcohol dehydrogenase [Chloroflexota bacterium]
MKAAVLYESFKPLVVEELELDAPHEHEVLVKLTASGVCHSDLHYMKGDREHPLPVVLGHEGAGIVEEIGPGVTYAQPGDHVVLSFVPTCGHCSYCVKGRQNLCEARYQLKGKMLDGTTRLHNSAGDVHHFNGLSTFGEYAVVPEDSLVKIREDAPLDRVALIGCGVPTGVGAVINTAKVKPGSSVVVIGVGGVGLNVVQGAVLAGAESIIAVDIYGDKLEHALQFGATHLVNAATEDLIEKVRDITRGEMADYAFEVIGSVDAINQALATTKRGGTTVIVGVAPKGAELTIDPDFLHLDRVLMGCTYGSVYPRADMPMLIDLYMARRLKLDELITATFKLDQINTAFEALDQGEVARSIIRY